jgi:hypothetical protein
MFGYRLARVRAAFANGLEKLKSRGHHLAVDKDSEGEILEWIQIQAENCLTDW